MFGTIQKNKTPIQSIRTVNVPRLYLVVATDTFPIRVKLLLDFVQFAFSFIRTKISAIRSNSLLSKTAWRVAIESYLYSVLLGKAQLSVHRSRRMADVNVQQGFDKNYSKERNVVRSKRKRLEKTDYLLRKRRPFGSGKKEGRDILITSKTPFKAQLKKCEKLLDNGASEIIIHGLGAAIRKACSLALRLKELHSKGIDLDVKTDTVSIIDDFEPRHDDADYQVNNRCNSAVRIRVFRTFAIGGLKYRE